MIHRERVQRSLGFRLNLRVWNFQPEMRGGRAMASETQPARLATGPATSDGKEGHTMITIVVTVWTVIAITVTVTIRMKRRR